MNPISLLTALLLVTSYQSTEHVAPTHRASGLEDVSWSLTALAGQTLIITSGRPAPKLLLTGADRRVSGTAGCNQISGAYEQDGASLRFATLEITQRACTDPVLKQRETLLLKALRDTRSWQTKGNTLIFAGPAGEVARFVQKAPAPD